MGRSKKNWDQLVDFYGNYGIDIANGIFPGSGNNPGIKGNKGEEGQRGFKGDQGNKGRKGEKGYGQKGQTGDVGPPGPIGAKGDAAGLFYFKGTKPDMGSLPNDPESGDVWWITDDEALVVWDDGEGEWVVLQGTLSVKGDKGEYGDIGPKGEPGVDGNQGAGGAQGDKGQKGEDYDPLVLDDYYKNEQIDAMIEFFHEPEMAFNVSYYKDTTSIVANELVNFVSNDQQDELYNPGIVVLEPSCTIQDSPVSSARQIVVNYVVDDASRARGLGYQMIQYVYAANSTNNEDDAYWRLVRPAHSEFGEWHLSQFNAERYYTKTELDARIGNQSLVLVDGLLDNTETIALSDQNGVINPSAVRIHTQGGLTLTRNNDTLTIDGSPLAGQLSFLGLVSITEDVSISVPSPVPGNYFIFKDSGVDINTGETVAAGDWLIYGEDPTEWRWLDMSQNYGVAEVRLKADDSYLTKTGITQFPELGFDVPSYEVDFPARDGTIDVMTGSIWSLDDIKTDYIRNQQREYSERVSWSQSLQQGQYAVNISTGKMRLAEKDANGANTENLLDIVMLSDGNFLEAEMENRSGNIAVKPDSVGTALDGYIIGLPNRNMAVFLSSPSGGKVTLIGCLERNDIEAGDSLLWNETEHKFIPGEAGRDIFLPKDGSEPMEGDLDMAGNSLTGLPNPPVNDSDAASKEWVLSLLEAMIQPGMIVFSPSNTAAPSGWYRLDGGTFNVNTNPNLNIALQSTPNYTAGILPDWGGRFLVQTGGDNVGHPGTKLDHMTALPTTKFQTVPGGFHAHKIGQTGSVSGDKSDGRFWPGDSGVNSGAAGEHSHDVTVGGDATTRPDCVTGYWLIKGG